MFKTVNLRIEEIKQLLPPVAILESIPSTKNASKVVFDSRLAIV